MPRSQLQVGPHRFDVEIDGPDDGPVVFLLHGWPQTTACWRDITPVLAAAGHRVAAPAQRGYSPAARPTDVASYRLDELVGDVLGMADALGAARFDVVGTLIGPTARSCEGDAPAARYHERAAVRVAPSDIASV